MQPDNFTECIDHNMSRSLRPEGYGLVTDPRKKSRCVSLHRLVYCEANGLTLDDIAGKVIRHSCDNPRCINPSHLLIGTRADNNRDRAMRGRSAKVVPSRQALTRVQCEEIKARYNPNRCAVNGVCKLAKDYGEDTNVIYRVVRGTYVASK